MHGQTLFGDFERTFVPMHSGSILLQRGRQLKIGGTLDRPRLPFSRWPLSNVFPFWP